MVPHRSNYLLSIVNEPARTKIVANNTIVLHACAHHTSNEEQQPERAVTVASTT
jgi:hypothetical protein